MAQVETTNQFENLEVEDGEKDADNQLTLVEIVTDQRSPTPNPTSAGKILNPVALVFNTNPVGTRATKE